MCASLFSGSLTVSVSQKHAPARPIPHLPLADFTVTARVYISHDAAGVDAEESFRPPSEYIETIKQLKQLHEVLSLQHLRPEALFCLSCLSTAPFFHPKLTLFFSFLFALQEVRRDMEEEEQRHQQRIKKWQEVKNRQSTKDRD